MLDVSLILVVVILGIGVWAEEAITKYRYQRRVNNRDKPKSKLTVKFMDVIAAIRGKYCVPVEFDKS